MIWTYVLLESNEVVGKLTIFNYNKKNYSAEFGYYLPKKYIGKGYDSKLASLLLKEIFNEPIFNLNKLYATTASGNINSIHLLESKGFSRDGIIRSHYWFEDRIEDQHHYSLLKSEYLNV